jgi:hypothetical protein
MTQTLMQPPRSLAGVLLPQLLQLLATRSQSSRQAAAKQLAKTRSALVLDPLMLRQHQTSQRRRQKRAANARPGIRTQHREQLLLQGHLQELLRVQIWWAVPSRSGGQTTRSSTLAQ